MPAAEEPAGRGRAGLGVAALVIELSAWMEATASQRLGILAAAAAILHLATMALWQSRGGTSVLPIVWVEQPRRP